MRLFGRFSNTVYTEFLDINKCAKPHMTLSQLPTISTNKIDFQSMSKFLGAKILLIFKMWYFFLIPHFYYEYICLRKTLFFSSLVWSCFLFSPWSKATLLRLLRRWRLLWYRFQPCKAGGGATRPERRRHVVSYATLLLSCLQFVKRGARATLLLATSTVLLLAFAHRGLPSFRLWKDRGDWKAFDTLYPLVI